MMRFVKPAGRVMALAGVVAAAMLAGCAPTGDLQRGLVGAGVGAVISDSTGGNALTGALIGGIGGTLCDDVGVAACR